MHDHDQRFKTLIQEFFAEFLLLFFAVWAERLDCSKVEWLDKEVFPDPPQGDRSVLDLVAKLPARQAIPGYPPDDNQTWLALVHIEIESPDKATVLRPRMYEYYTALRKRHGLPVLPIAIYLKVGMKGIGIDEYEEHFWELRPIRFEYLYVGLPALDALEYPGERQLARLGLDVVDEDSEGKGNRAWRRGAAENRWIDAVGPEKVPARRVRASLLAVGTRPARGSEEIAGHGTIFRSQIDEQDFF